MPFRRSHDNDDPTFVMRELIEDMRHEVEVVRPSQNQHVDISGNETTDESSDDWLSDGFVLRKGCHIHAKQVRGSQSA